ncbi:MULTISPECIES: NifB/NifX family molybdenum-iron cluster-binding protein [Thermococcus]|uniref:Iron-molybdenum cofactor-binding protein n=2 Tax=Thermococcus sibiricus TaxID=172049 RepID=C6A552_THESM|nr:MULTISPECIES: NifB/NifX family molybdenum-iron cluster-binding protein [Thermococcus]ACS90747.1 Iron-molybdenum cofactor-binding protein [Thermococcus sibiricus MM 739]MBC7094230.1 NifB/NifX family molybdenum-iron cluster-binding protein [Thermococcus sp.]
MPKVAVPTSKGGLDDRVHESLVRAETFTVVELDGGNIKEVQVIENPYRGEPHGAGPKVALFLVNLGVDVLLTPMECPKGKPILEAGGVRIVKVKAGKRVEEALRSLRSSL